MGNLVPSFLSFVCYKYFKMRPLRKIGIVLFTITKGETSYEDHSKNAQQ